MTAADLLWIVPALVLWCAAVHLALGFCGWLVECSRAEHDR